MLATLGLSGGVVLTFLYSLPAWMSFVGVGFAAAAASSVATWWVQRRRVVRPLQQISDGRLEVLAVLKRQHDKVKQENEELADFFSGDSWPAEDSLIADLQLFDQTTSVVLKGTKLATRAEVDFHVRVYVVCPFPVVMRHFTMDVSCAGPGMKTEGHYDKPTGWGPKEPRRAADFQVKATFDAQAVPAALQGHALITVRGHVVVGSDAWETDTRFYFTLTGRCMVRSELPSAEDEGPLFSSEPPRGFG